MGNQTFHLFRNSFVALIVGLLFSLGLGIAGMTQPEKVIGFLDVAETWDPSLLFVMIGAVGFHFVTYHLIRKRNSPLFSTVWHVPTKRDLTPTLVIGSFILESAGVLLRAIAQVLLSPHWLVLKLNR